MPTLYLITKESFGFRTIFDSLDPGRSIFEELDPSRYGVGRNDEIDITDPSIPEIPAQLALTWDAQDPLTPQQVAPFLGLPASNSIALFASILTDQNISDPQDFWDFGYAVYEIAPGGDLISEFDFPTLVYGAFSDGIPFAGTDFINQKIAVFGDEAFEDRLTEAGAIAVRIPLAEVPAALQTGVIDGVLGTDASILDTLETLGGDVFTAEVGETGILNIAQILQDPVDPGPEQPPLPDAIDLDGLYVISANPSFQITDGVIEAIGDPNFTFVVPVQLYSFDEIGVYIEHSGQRWRIGDAEGYNAIPSTVAPLSLRAGESQALVGDGEAVADFWEYRADHQEFFAGWNIFEIDPETQSLSVISLSSQAQADDGPNVLEGDTQDNDLAGLGGDDELRGNSGNDVLDGGAGYDTASYSGSRSAYTVKIALSGQTVEDRRSTGDGTDTLTDIENLTFSDASWSLDIFAGVGGLSEVELREFVEVYIAYFNRAPDAEGLFFYGTAFANGTSLQASAATFLNSVEYQSTYPSDLSNRSFAEAVYNNVLGRIPDQLGLEFWVNVLDSGARSRDVFILEVLQGAKAPPPSDADDSFIQQKAADVAYLENKTDIGLYFSVTKGMSNVANATEVMQIFGDGDPSDISLAVSAIDAYHDAALHPDTGEFLLQLVGVVDDPFAV